MDARGFQNGSIQLGDFNLAGYDGWKPKEDHRVAFIDGNHENFPNINKDGDAPQEIRPGLFYIPRGWVCGRVMFMGGAESIDHQHRHLGYDLFYEESISQGDFQKAMNYKGPIEAMLSHTCPDFVGCRIFTGARLNMPSEKALTLLWEEFRPKLWVFGHFHKSFDEVIHGTRFVCLPECQAGSFDLPLADWPGILSSSLPQEPFEEVQD
jgi:hypothetical protein